MKRTDRRRANGREPIQESFVYLGFADAPGGDLFVKVGKSNHPEKRARAYLTHFPGGLKSMHAVRLPSEPEAFSAECRLLGRLQNMAWVKPSGGEWFRAKHDALEQIFKALLEEAGEPELIPMPVPLGHFGEIIRSKPVQPPATSQRTKARHQAVPEQAGPYSPGAAAKARGAAL